MKSLLRNCFVVVMLSGLSPWMRATLRYFFAAVRSDLFMHSVYRRAPNLRESVRDAHASGCYIAVMSSEGKADSMTVGVSDGAKLLDVLTKWFPKPWALLLGIPIAVALYATCSPAVLTNMHAGRLIGHDNYVLAALYSLSTCVCASVHWIFSRLHLLSGGTLRRWKLKRKIAKLPLEQKQVLRRYTDQQTRHLTLINDDVHVSSLLRKKIICISSFSRRMTVFSITDEVDAIINESDVLAETFPSDPLPGSWMS